MLWNKDFTRAPLRFSIMDNLLEIKFFSQNLHAFIVFFFHCMLAGLGKRVVSSFETVAFGFGFSISHLKSSLC